MSEEHKCQSPPEGHRLCANNCGFFGSPATHNLCSKCYRDLHLTSPASPLLSSPPSPTPLLLKPSTTTHPQLTSSSGSHTSPDAIPNTSSTTQPTRCSTCRKRVGLTGFRCRCGETYCGVHRYPENHACGFDFKSVGKDEIARANPVVKATKLERI